MPFHRRALRSLSALPLLSLLAACGGGGDAAQDTAYYQTKTPYKPQQGIASYEAAPAGFAPVYTEMLARHGSRGLSSFKYDLALYNLWTLAKADNALTDLGARLGPDILRISKANFLLGYGVSGISKPGYGNETQVGIDEHTQLAQRLLQRLPTLFAPLGSNAAGGTRQIAVVTSGVDRAVDSGNYFVASLKAAQPALAGRVAYPPAPAGYPASAPVAQPAGTNRFLLYFHKLVPATDLVTSTTDPYYATYAASQAYQAYAQDADQAAKQAALAADPTAKTASRAVLERLFTKAFVDRIDAGTVSTANTGSMSFTSDDGKFSSTLTGDGKSTIKSAVDAASFVYELYSIAPAMAKETGGLDFTPYMPAAQAAYFAAFNDGSDFYSKGPGITEKGNVTWRMAQVLQDDFFNEVDAIAKGDTTRVAKLRFAHAEITIPFATQMGLKTASQQTPLASLYSYDNNPWRGSYVSPMAANMQWDVYGNGSGTLLVRMLYNEKETDFKAACDGAKYAGSSHYYDYGKLKACYGRS